MAILQVERKVGELAVVGKSVPRVDAKEKVTGRAKFVRDIVFPGMLYGKMVRSSYPHAKIVKIDTSEAEKIPGVVAIVTAKDIPGKNIVPLIIGDEPFLAEDRVLFYGEPVAAIAAISEEIAEEAAKKVKVEYEPLDPVLDVLKAIEPDSPKLHNYGNIASSYRIIKGDVEEGFKNADVVVEHVYKTHHQEQAYLEPQGMIAVPNPDDSITVYGTMQCPYYVQNAVSAVLGYPRHRVRIIQTTTGGGFGGKEDIPSRIAGITALLAYKAKKPVKLVYTRDEDILVTSKRHPAIIKYKSGVTKDGKLVAIKIEMYYDAGAYATLSPAVLWRGIVHAVGPYKCPNISIEAYAVTTNRMPSGAFRGFGEPQVVFAHETQMDELAEKLGMDPAEFRLLNVLESGDATATGQIVKDIGLKETLLKALEMSDWKNKRKEYEMWNSRERRFKKGIGISCAFYGVSLGASGKHLDGAGAVVQVTPDGGVIVAVGTTEMGQGMKTVLTQIAAEEFGISIDDVYLMETDTAVVPDSGPTVASRSTLMSGNAIRDACRKIKHNLLKVAAQILSEDESNLRFENGFIVSTENPDKKVSFKEAASEGYKQRLQLAATGWYKASPTSFDKETGHGDAYITYSYATHITEVIVDTATGKVKPTHIVAVHDSGKIINPVLAEGQVQGGVVQGLGYALMEEIIENKEGIPLNANFTDYLIPTSMDVPDIDVAFVETHYEEGPYGAKGLGEVPLLAYPPSLTNAIYHATGARLYEIPATPERVYFAIKKRKA
mgnify:FL=1